MDTQNGITVILVERGEGVDTKPIKTMYSATAGTAFVTLDSVKVPIENTIGPENSGLSVIFSYVPVHVLSLKLRHAQLDHRNFNHERWVVCNTSTALQRLIIEDVFKCVLFTSDSPWSLTMGLGKDGSTSAWYLASLLLRRR